MWLGFLLGAALAYRSPWRGLRPRHRNVARGVPAGPRVWVVTKLATGGEDLSFLKEEDSSIVGEAVPWEQGARLRADELRRSISAQRLELEALERRLICCAAPEARAPITFRDTWAAFSGALGDSAAVFRRRYEASPDPSAYLINETSAALRILGRGILLPAPERDAKLASLVKNSPLLAVHAPGILSRLDRLEAYVPGIVAAVLDGDHLGVIEPHLDGILDRFDDIEPHVPWVLDNIDALAPHVGVLMRHIDELLLYADEENKWADTFMPYLPYFISRLDQLGPHLPLLRPHLRKLQPHFRTLVPCLDRCLLKPNNFDVSANADVLLFWFGWALRVPLMARCLVACPGGPRLIAFAARRLPRGPVRQYCSDVTCYLSYEVGAYGKAWNRRYAADYYADRPV